MPLQGRKGHLHSIGGHNDRLIDSNHLTGPVVVHHGTRRISYLPRARYRRPYRRRQLPARCGSRRLSFGRRCQPCFRHLHRRARRHGSRCRNGHLTYKTEDTRTPCRYPHHDRALLRQPAYHGQSESLASAYRYHLHGLR